MAAQTLEEKRDMLDYAKEYALMVERVAGQDARLIDA